MVHLSSRRPGMRERRCDCRRAKHLTIFRAGVKSFAEKYSALPKFGNGEQSSGELRREGAKACQPFDVRAGSKAVASYSVIASHRGRAKRGPMTGSAKQSRLSPRKNLNCFAALAMTGEGVVVDFTRGTPPPRRWGAPRASQNLQLWMPRPARVTREALPCPMSHFCALHATFPCHLTVIAVRSHRRRFLATPGHE